MRLRLFVVLSASVLWGCAGAGSVADRSGVTNAWGPTRDARAAEPTEVVTGEIPLRTTAARGCAEPLAETEPLYALPYAVGETYYVRQGTCGSATHSGRFAFAYDFDMPRGTEVLAARDGVVSAVVDHFPEDTNRSEHANYVVVRHPDGQASRYLHLQTGGARVAVGDSVRTGDVLALSGNSGRSVTPHLHFDVVGACDGPSDCPTLPATFTNAGDPAPRTGQSYAAGGH